MQIIKKIIMLAVLFAGIGIGYFAWRGQQDSSGLQIKNFNYDKDAAVVDQLFHKGDNLYWMLCNQSHATGYSIDFMLRNQTSCQYAKKHDLILKTATIDGKIVGFLAYYPESIHVWRLLFLMVDQDYRRQGIAKKLLNFVVSDMFARGALQIILATRNNNFKAQKLYENFGFSLVDSDYQFVHFSLRK